MQQWGGDFNFTFRNILVLPFALVLSWLFPNAEFWKAMIKPRPRNRRRRQTYYRELYLGQEPYDPANPNLQHREQLTRPSSPTITPDHLNNRATIPVSAIHTLPLELRQSIWKLALGGLAIHLHMKHNMFLIGGECISESAPDCQGSRTSGCTRDLVSDSEASITATKRLRKRRLLSLLLSCKDIYRETVEVLYQANYFLVDEEVVRCLPNMILYSRMNSVRALSVTYGLRDYPPFDPKCEPFGARAAEAWAAEDGQHYLNNLRRQRADWERIWRQISSMQGLKVLRVELKIIELKAWSCINSKYGSNLLLPIREVVTPDDFTLVLPFQRHERNGQQMPNYPILGYEYTIDETWDGHDIWGELHCKIERTVACR